MVASAVTMTKQEHWRNYYRRRVKADPTWVSNKNRKGKFKISPEEFAVMLKQVGNKCEICCEEESCKPVLSVDHSHVTGKVRGLLCHRCNSALGWFRDDPELLEQAAAYLRRSQ